VVVLDESMLLDHERRGVAVVLLDAGHIRMLLFYRENGDRVSDLDMAQAVDMIVVECVVECGRNVDHYRMCFLYVTGTASRYLQRVLATLVDDLPHCLYGVAWVSIFRTATDVIELEMLGLAIEVVFGLEWHGLAL
jgi:hypothetical protein